MRMPLAPSVLALGGLLLMVDPAHASNAVHWSPMGVASPQFESHAAFDLKNGDFYFLRSTPEFSGWRILVSHCTAKGWSEPKAPDFAAPGLEADPWFTPDGKTLYYISTRAHAELKSNNLDIWRVDRGTDGGWGEPERLPEPVNSGSAEWFPRVGSDGWLYFGSNRPGGLGGNDIWRARSAAGGGWTVENLGASVNTVGDEYEPLPSPDGSRLVVMADGGLYESKRAAGGWSPRTKLGPEIARDGSEIGAAFSPSGRTLLFSRDLKSAGSGEFFVWRDGAPEAWPPECPAHL
ncbi:MAG: hypothetical protein ABI609_15810 [Acidobacteriota bacterium]